MEKPEKVDLDFHKPILNMMEDSQTMHDDFVDDEPDFIVKFPDLAPPFAANWQTAIDIADALPSNEQVKAQIGQLSQELEVQMVLARNQYQTLVIYVKLAYPEDEAILKVFGQNLYESARRNPLEMIELLELSFGVANVNPYKPALMAKGITAADIALLKTIELALRGKNKALEAAKSKRPFATQTLHKALNAVWAMNVKVNTAAQLVYKDDYAKQQQYLLYPDGESPALTEVLITVNLTGPQAVSFDLIAMTPAGGNLHFAYDDGTSEDVFITGAGVYTNVVHFFATAGVHKVKISGDKGEIGEIRTNNDNVITLDFPDDMSPRNVTAEDNQLSSFSLPDTFVLMMVLKMKGNNLNDVSVNNALIHFDNNGLLSGYIDLSAGTNAPPTGAGLAAKNNLIGKGWTVITN